MSLRTLPVAVWVLGAAVAGLILYTIVMGYHREFDLMLAVIIVRLAAGVGVGVFVAAVFAAVRLITRRKTSFGAFASMSAYATSVTVIALVLLNLLQAV